MALFTYGWPLSQKHQMFGLCHQWSCLTTCEWPPPNLWVAPAEFMDGPSAKNFKNFNAKTDQFYTIWVTVTLTNFSKFCPSPLQLPLIWVFVHFRARSLISIYERLNENNNDVGWPPNWPKNRRRSYFHSENEI